MCRPLDQGPIAWGAPLFEGSRSSLLGPPRTNMDTLNPNLFIHAANILLLVAYSVRDVLWLRLFAVASALVAIPYFLLQPAPLWAALAWSALFAVINALQSWRLYLERRPV